MTNEQKKIIKARVGVLELAKQLGNVSQACKTMGYSRDTFYRYQQLYEQGGEEALLDVTKRKPPLCVVNVSTQLQTSSKSCSRTSRSGDEFVHVSDLPKV